ncbi:MAG: hypothetical protein O3B74_07590 [Proteobacteria bacterium]|nr:hypothetical protein [Pseudomonadota bacterium]MDA1308258.1 hypothetical protein [Pseudomonadota bacterium]
METITEKPKILVLSAVWPYVHGNVQAAEVVPFEIIRGLAVDEGFDVGYCCAWYSDMPVTDAAAAAIEEAKGFGVRFLPFVKLPPWLPSGGRVGKWLRAILLHDPYSLLPGYGQEGPLRAALDAEGWMPDIVVPIWNYELTAAAAGLGAAMYAFYGNPDFKVYQANLDIQWRWERQWSPGWIIRYVPGPATGAGAGARSYPHDAALRADRRECGQRL